MLKSKNKGKIFFLNCRIILLMFVKLFGKVTNRMIYPITTSCIKTLPAPVSLASTASLNSFANFGAKRTGSFLSMAFSIPNAFLQLLVQLNFVRMLSKLLMVQQ